MALIACPECGNTVSTQAAACPQCGAPPLPAAASIPPAVPVAAAIPMGQSQLAAEETIHSDSSVTVTTSRIMIFGTTYALRNITSVRMASTAPDIGGAIAFLVIGILGALLALGLLVSGQILAGSIVLIAGGGVIAGAIAWLRSLKPSYHVAICSSSQEGNALTSKSRPYVEHIVNCVNDAIVRYRS
jgi:hypothetical protein